MAMVWDLFDSSNASTSLQLHARDAYRAVVIAYGTKKNLSAFPHPSSSSTKPTVQSSYLLRIKFLTVGGGPGKNYIYIVVGRCHYACSTKIARNGIFLVHMNVGSMSLNVQQWIAMVTGKQRQTKQHTRKIFHPFGRSSFRQPLVRY